MVKYLLLHISGQLYYARSNAKTKQVQEFQTETEDAQSLNDLLDAFCAQLNSKFEVYLFTDNLTLQTIDLSKQGENKNPKLLEQFLRYELESVLDFIGEDSLIEFNKSTDGLYHCLLAESHFLNDLKNTCQKHSGKLIKVAHPAGFFTSIKPGLNIEVYQQTIHCQTNTAKQTFSMNSSLLADFEEVQSWMNKQSANQFILYDLAKQSRLPLEGEILKPSLTDIKVKELVKAFKSQAKKTPAFRFRKKSQSVKKYLPLVASSTVSFTIFLFFLLSNISLNNQLETDIAKLKKEEQSLSNKKTKLLNKFSEIPSLKKEISHYQAQEFILENTVFWPTLLDKLAESFDENSQLQKLSTDSNNNLNIEGITVDLMQVQKLISKLKNDKELKLIIFNKNVKKSSAYGGKVWQFSIIAGRKQI